MNIYLNNSKTATKWLKILSILVCSAFLWNQLVFASGGEIPLQMDPVEDYQGYFDQWLKQVWETVFPYSAFKQFTMIAGKYYKGVV